MSRTTEATIEDLYCVPEDGKAEIVNGKLVLMSPTGFLPGRAGGEIYASLRDYERRTRSGYALPDNVGFIVNLPNRRSFSPDAALYIGQPTGGTSSMVRQFLLLKLEAKMITVMQQKRKWQPSVRITLRRGRWWYGM